MSWPYGHFAVGIMIGIMSGQMPMDLPQLLHIIVELRTPAMPVGVGGGKERGGFHLNLRT